MFIYRGKKCANTVLTNNSEGFTIISSTNEMIH